jgi:hypothetical protein
MNEYFGNNTNTEVVTTTENPKNQIILPSISQVASSVVNTVQSSGVVAKTSDAVAQVSGAVAQVSGAVAQVSGAVAQVSGAVSQVSGAVAQVSPPVNNFTEFDGNYNDTDGADINIAYEAPIPSSNTVISAVDINKSNVQNYDAKDFLPKEINDQWFDTDFSQAKYNVNNDTLINTDRYVIGINTVGQSLKNASYDIRGTIPNPKYTISPWNNSTYEPDYNIKPLCNA